MKFAEPFIGVVDGEVYPRHFEPGEECPPELLEAAKALGVLAAPAKPAPKSKASK